MHKKDAMLRNGQMCIVTDPNIDIAIKLIKRMKNFFESKLHIIFQRKETVLELNGCRIEAYPSNHVDSFRALDNPKFMTNQISGERARLIMFVMLLSGISQSRILILFLLAHQTLQVLESIKSFSLRV